MCPALVGDRSSGKPSFDRHTRKSTIALHQTSLSDVFLRICFFLQHPQKTQCQKCQKPPLNLSQGQCQKVFQCQKPLLALLALHSLGLPQIFRNPANESEKPSGKLLSELRMELHKFAGASASFGVKHSEPAQIFEQGETLKHSFLSLESAPMPAVDCPNR